MSGVRPLIDLVTAPVRAVNARLSKTVGDLRAQAPGARMVGEFAVKLGFGEIGKRLKGGQKPPQE